MNLSHIFLKPFILALLVICSLPLNAQEEQLKNATPEQISEKQTQLISEKLELNANETAQLKTINLKYANELKALKEQGRSPETRQKLVALNHAHNTEVEGILKKEDFEKYLVLKQNMFRKKMQKMRARKDRVEVRNEMVQKRQALMEKLNLNEAQKNQLKTIRENYKEKREDLKAEGRSKENFEKMKALQQAQNEEVKAVLDPEQYDVYLEIQKKREERFKQKKKKLRRQD